MKSGSTRRKIAEGSNRREHYIFTFTHYRNNFRKEIYEFLVETSDFTYTSGALTLHYERWGI